MNSNAGATAAGGAEDRAEPLAAEIRRRLGAPPEPRGWPPVSIVVVNRDGAPHLRRLLAGLGEQTDYRSFELIVVDNDSGDQSVGLLRAAEAPFPISIVANPHNESFSDACNKGAELASGELLLFLNNDIEPFEPAWLRELVGCLQARSAGIAGSTLIRPANDPDWGYRVQHRAIRIADEDGMLSPDRRGYGADPLGEGFGEDADSVVAAGACMLMECDLFRRVGGFTHGFFYGAEDIDLGLKVLAEGAPVVCSGRSLLIHRLGSTRTKTSAEKQLAIGRGNRRLLWERWGPRLRREYELDRLSGGGSWAVADEEAAASPPSRDEVLALGFCLKSSEPAAATFEDDPLPRLREALAQRGHRCTVLRGEAVDDLTGLNYDVAVHLRGPQRYIPATGQLNVLWVPSRLDAVTAIECSRYDLVLAQDERFVERLRGNDLGCATPPTIVLPSGMPADDMAKRLAEAVEARVREIKLPLRIASGQPRS